MTAVTALHQFGSTRQQLLKQLLGEPQGLSVQSLCTTLDISHNAVRQHLNALMSAGFVRMGREQPTGGRPEARYLLSKTGRGLFPRHYEWIAIGLLEEIHQRRGREEAIDMLDSMGRRFGRQLLSGHSPAGSGQRLAALAERLDELGYAARLTGSRDQPQIEARNCPFEAVGHRFPEVCHFNKSLLEAASGRPVTLDECIIHGQHLCRFSFAAADPS